MAQPDFIESMADEIGTWLERTSDIVATGVFGGKPPSHTVKLSRQQKREYWAGLSLPEKADLWPKLSVDEQQELGPLGV